VTLPAFQILREWLQQHPDATVLAALADLEAVKILTNAREQHARTYQELQQKRRERDQLSAVPNARSEIISATEAAIGEVLDIERLVELRRLLIQKAHNGLARNSGNDAESAPAASTVA
jgi:hypothetical protein